MDKLLRGFMVAGVTIVGLLIAAACAPAAAPTPTAAPTKPSPMAASKPAEATPAASKPAPAAAAKPAASADWKAEWDKTLAAAKKEGKVVVAGAPGDGYRKAVEEFRKAYPDIALEYTGGSTGRVHTPKILSEREAGLYNWDVLMGAGSVLVPTFIPVKALAPLRPALILPEVVDDSKWLGGFDSGWLDKAGQYVHSPLPYLSYTMHVNREHAPEAELRTHDDLLNPKWKGKIAWSDPLQPGSGQMNARYFYFLKGEDWLRKLLAQDIVVAGDPRAMLENLIRGTYAIASGTREVEVNEFERAGLTGHLQYLDPGSKMGANLTSGTAAIAMFDKAPHPNAAKVFLNWYFSREAHQAYVREAGIASLRLDVESPPELKARPADVNTHSEAFLERVVPMADKVIEEMLK